jgi:flagellar biosynthesis/type III secretory pathway protein FliH
MGNPFDDMFSAFARQRPDMFAAFEKGVHEGVEQKVAERIQTLIRKAQNNIDRAHNRAIRAAAEVEDLDFFAKKKILRLVKPVRHAEEFGES